MDAVEFHSQPVIFDHDFWNAVFFNALDDGGAHDVLARIQEKEFLQFAPVLRAIDGCELDPAQGAISTR